MANLSKDAAKVLVGFSKLDYGDRSELMKLFNEYQDNVNTDLRKSLVENSKVQAGLTLGPTSQGGCPCCGK